jgi:hypothetical protein
MRTIHSHRGLALAVMLTASLVSAQQQQEQQPPPTDPPIVVTPPPSIDELQQARIDAAQPTEAVADPTPPRAAFVKGEGFRLLSEDGNFKLRVGLQAAAAYQPTFVRADTSDETTSNWSQFRVPYARLRVDGHLYKTWLRYWFSFEFSGFPPFLLDGYVEAQPFKYFGVRLGQMYTPISRHEYFGPQEILFPDWAITADYFWPGRDKGIQIFGEGDYLWYYVGFFGGSGLRQTFTTPGNFQTMARITVNPLGPMGWGEIPYAMTDGEVPFRVSASLQGYWGKVVPSSLGFNSSNGFYQRSEGPERFHGLLAADVMLQWDRFGFLSEVYGRRVESTTTSTEPFWQAGVWAQANYTFYKRVLDFAVRGNWIDPSTSLSNDVFVAGEALLTWFVKAPYFILRLRYAVGHQESPGPAPANSPELFDVLSLPFQPGTGHQVTLQASAYF